MQQTEYQSSLGQCLDKAIIFGLLFLMVFSTLVFGTVEPWSIGIFSLIIVLLLFIWAIKAFSERRFELILPSSAFPLMLILLYGAFQTVSVMDEKGRRWSISMDPEATRLTLEVMAVLLVGLMLISGSLMSRDRLKLFANFLIFWGLAQSIFGMIQYFTWNGKYYWIFDPSVTPSSPFGSFVNHNHFAGYIEMIVPIPVALIITSAIRGELAMIYGFTAAIMGIATIVSLSRGGMLSLLAGLMFVIILGLRPAVMRREPSDMLRFPLFLSRVGASLVIIFTIGVGVLWVGGDAVINRVEKTALPGEERTVSPSQVRRESFFQARGWIWRDTGEIIKNNWGLGVGLGAFQTAYSIYSKHDGSLVVGQSHNDYLQILADCGIIGGIAVLLFIFLLFRDILKAIKHRDPFLSGLALGCGGGAFAMLVHSLFDFNLQLPSNALLFLSLSAAIYLVRRSAEEGSIRDAFFERGSKFTRVAPEMEVWS